MLENFSFLQGNIQSFVPVYIIMIRDYKKLKVIGELGENGIIYDALKNDKKFYLYQFEEYDEADAYNFKVIGKLLSSHILAVHQQFQQNGVKYIVTDYAEKDLLQLQTFQPSKVFPLPVALDYFAKIILALQELHQCKLVYRNIRPEVIKVRQDNLYFYDFTFSQFCKRKQRIFDIVGCQSFLAPQFFLEDGYSFQVDIWAAGVILFFMLTHQYPFKFKSKNQKSSLQQLKLLCQNGFSFEKRLQSCKNPGFIKSNKILQDFFCKIFAFEYTQRITINRIKQHKLMAGYFPEKIDKDILEAIGQQQSNINSLLMTTFLDLKKFKISKEIEKQQLILDFIQRCSQSLMLDCAEHIPQQIRNKAQFSILKVAMIRINSLIDVCYGKKKPQFQYDQEQFQSARSSSAFKKVIESIQKKQKIFHMLYKSAYVQLTNKNQDPFFAQQIPEDFNQIKIAYRLTLSQMFEVAKNIMAKNKSEKQLIRKLAQVMARMVIMHLINRIFEQQDFHKNFALYLAWNKNESIQNLDSWIHAQKQQSLKQFIKQTTKNYL